MAVRINKPSSPKGGPFGAAGMAVGAMFGSPQAGGAIGNMVGGMVGSGGDVPEVGGSSMQRKMNSMTAPQGESFKPEEIPIDIPNPMQRKLLRTPEELEAHLRA